MARVITGGWWQHRGSAVGTELLVQMPVPG